MVSVSLSEDRLKKIDKYVESGKYPDRSSFITNACDYLFLHHETNFIIELMYWVAIPLFLFMFSTTMAYFFVSYILFGIAGISGIYLMIFVYMFFKKYRGIRNWQKEL